jgi:hypothetical protein
MIQGSPRCQGENPPRLVCAGCERRLQFLSRTRQAKPHRETRLALFLRTEAVRRHECRRGTHECVRHRSLGLSTWLFTYRLSARPKLSPALTLDRPFHFIPRLATLLRHTMLGRSTRAES